MSEPHTIVVRVWYNAKWHDVKYVPITAKILRTLYHDTRQKYFNPTDDEWQILRQYKLPDRWEGQV